MKSMEMEEQQLELKHVCKFCSKSFACGRSLGGHMRSHMINDISSLADGTKLTKKKLPHLSTYLISNSNSNHNKNKDITTTTTTTTTNISPGSPGYILRENPKRSLKFSDHNSGEENNTNNNSINNNNSVVLDKSCKECGKVFQSWKALFGHIKFHSMEKERFSNNNNCLEEEEEKQEQQDSWTIANNNNNSNQKLVMDSHSDNETAAPSRRKRSKRRTKCMGNTANSSSLFVPNNASSSVSETEQEQEEVALCLIMLSRDVGQWGGLNSLAESSDNNSVSLGTNPISTKSGNVKNSACSGREALKAKMKSPDDKKPETTASGIKKSLEENQGKFDNSQVEIGEYLMKENGVDELKGDADRYIFLSKRKSIDCFDSEMKDSLKNSKAIEAEGSSKFECTTCNKVFHSYQALGGHRASHKKIKGCFAYKIDSGENGIETESSPDQISDSNKLTADKFIKPTSNEIPTDQLPINWDERAETSNGTKKSKVHECPVCLKVFPSGQALGGHKRAHMAGDAEAKNNQTVSTQEPIPAIRNFLDLNLPAPVEEESNGINVGFNPWWIGSSHNHEPLIGLISN